MRIISTRRESGGGRRTAAPSIHAGRPGLWITNAVFCTFSPRGGEVRNG